MLVKIKYSIWLLVIINYLSCTDYNKVLCFDFLFKYQNEQTVIEIKPTNYIYEGGRIYTIPIADLDIYRAFYNSHFIWIDKNEAVYSLNISEACIDNYKNNDFKLFDESSPPHNVACDINRDKILDFNISVGDTIRRAVPIWFTLESKVYASELKDSVFNFVSHFYDEEKVVTSVSKKIGIVGIALRKDTTYTSILGKIWLKDTSKTNIGDAVFKYSETTVNLSIIKQLELCQLKN